MEDELREMSRATIVGVVVLLTAWVFLSVAVWQATTLRAGWDVAERLVPYANAHLLEEAADGRYKPWRDPVFLFGVIANSVVPVTIATLVAARLHARAPFAVIAVGVLHGLRPRRSSKLAIFSFRTIERIIE